jgi:hypothetical protein
MPRMLRLTLLAPVVLVDILDGRCVQSDEAPPTCGGTRKSPNRALREIRTNKAFAPL